MAATLTALVRAFASIGSESVRAEVERTIASMRLVHNRLVNVPENSGTIVTLWAAADLAAWSYGVVMVDPSDVKPTLALPIVVTQQIAGAGATFFSMQVTREVPLLMANRARGAGASEVLAAVTNFGANNLSNIFARNTAAVGAPAGANDVEARILLFGA